MKKIFILLLLSQALYSQTVTALIGYNCAEINYKIKGDLNYGIAVSVTSSKDIAKRANNNNNSYDFHFANTNVSPSVFFLIGGTFDNITITGKVGATYFDQNINNIKEPQNIYRSVGVQFQYKNFLFSYDSTNSAMIGYEFNL